MGSSCFVGKVSQYFSAEKMLKGWPGPEWHIGMCVGDSGPGPVNDNGVCTVVDTLFQFSHQTWLLPRPSHPPPPFLVTHCSLFTLLL